MHLRGFRALALAGLAFCGCCAAFAQSNCEVTIPVVVLPDANAGAATVPGKLSIQVDGGTVSPTEIPKPRSHRVAVLLDASGSMEQHWHFAKDLASDIVRAFTPADEVAFIAFASKPEATLAATADRELLLSAVNAVMQPKSTKAGRTAMFDTLASVVQAEAHYDAVVLITDGGDNASRMTGKELKKVVAASDARIFAFLFLDRAGPTTTEEAEAPQFLGDLVEFSGGIDFLPLQWDLRTTGKPARLDDASARRITAFLQLLKNAIDNPTLVHISWPQGVQPKGKNPFKIELMDEKGKKIGNHRLAYSRRTPHCSTAQASGAAAPANPN